MLDNVRGHAREAGIDPELTAGLMELLIAASLTRQEQDTVRALSQGDGKRALVIGGSGRRRRMVRALPGCAGLRRRSR